MDDFYKPSIDRISFSKKNPVAPNFDWQRLKSEVLRPITEGTNCKFQVYDWDKDSLGDWVSIEKSRIVLIEGVSVIRQEIRDFFDFKVWIECSIETRLDRGIQRNGESMRNVWLEQWIPAEDLYIERHQPQKVADIVINGENLCTNIELIAKACN